MYMESDTAVFCRAGKLGATAQMVQQVPVIQLLDQYAVAFAYWHNTVVACSIDGTSSAAVDNIAVDELVCIAVASYSH
jgi:hypothetical protein